VYIYKPLDVKKCRNFKEQTPKCVCSVGHAVINLSNNVYLHYFCTVYVNKYYMYCISVFGARQSFPILSMNAKLIKVIDVFLFVATRYIIHRSWHKILSRANISSFWTRNQNTKYTDVCKFEITKYKYVKFCWCFFAWLPSWSSDPSGSILFFSSSKSKKKFELFSKRTGKLATGRGNKKLVVQPYWTVYLSLATLHMSPNLRKWRPTFIFSYLAENFRSFWNTCGLVNSFFKKLPNEVKASSFFCTQCGPE
jgi:hypothetical protein